MNYRKLISRTFAAVLLCTAASLNSMTVAAQDQPVIVMHTFDVHAKAEAFIEMIDKGIKMAKETDPEGVGQIHVLAGHVEPESASQIIIFTTYPSMDAYIANKEAMERDPGLQDFNKVMNENDFKMVHQSINTLVAEY